MKNKQLQKITFFILLLSNQYLKAQTWSPVGTGLNGTNGDIGALAEYNGELYVGGDVDYSCYTAGFSAAGGAPANNIAKWNGTNWSPVGTGMNGAIHSLAVYNGELYAGGGFNSAGGIPANNIAKWDGASWSTVGTGVNSCIKSLKVFNGELYAGGYFTTAGGNTANRIAKWNGVSWSPLGSGMDGGVEAIEAFNGVLYAGGCFTAAGGYAANAISDWNGYNWTNSSIVIGFSSLGAACVYDLKVYNGELYAGGIFTAAGGNPAFYIARWNGTNWLPVGAGSNGPVNALGVYNGELYSSGFYIASDGYSGNISKWNGTVWLAAGNGVNGDVKAIETYNENLYIGGGFTSAFTSAGSVSASFIAKLSMVSNIEESQQNNKVTISPNPSSGIFTISASKKFSDIEIFDVLGKIVFKDNSLKSNIDMDFSIQLKGIYFYKVTDQNKLVKFGKVIIE